MNQAPIKNILFSILLLFFPDFISAQDLEKPNSDTDTTLAQKLILQSDSLLMIYQAEQALEKALAAKAIYTKASATQSKKLADIYAQIAKVLNDLEKPQEAIDNYKLAIDLYQKHYGNNHHMIGELLNDLGVVYTNLGEFKEALQYHNRGIAFKEKYNIDNLSSLATSYVNKASTFQYLSQVDSAIAFLNKALEIRKNVFGEKSIQVATIINSLGSCQGQLGNHKEEIKYLLQALSIFETHDDSLNAGLLRCYNNLGFAYKSFNDYSKALEYHQLYLDSQIKKNGPKSLGTGIAYNNLSTDYIDIGKYKKAKELAEKALNAIPDNLPKDHPHYGSFNSVLARCYSELGDNQRAIEIHEKSLNIAIKKYGEKHARLLYAFHNLGANYSDNGQNEKAIEYFLKAYEAHSSNFDEIHPNVPYFYEGIANASIQLKNYAQAEKYYQKANKIQVALNSDHPATLSRTHYNIGRVNYHRGNYKIASEEFEISSQLSYKAYGSIHPVIATYYHALANSLHKEKRYAVADSIYQKSLNAYNYQTAYQFKEVNQIDRLINLLQAIGFYYQDQFKLFNIQEDLLKSESYFDQAIKAIEFKSTYVSPDSKNNLAKIFSETYIAQISNLMYSKDIPTLKINVNEAVFNLAEKSKAGILLNAIQESKALEFSGIPDSLLQLEYNLRLETVALEKLRQSKMQIKDIEKDTSFLNLSNTISNLNIELELLKKQFEKNYPKYYKAKYDLSTINISAVQQIILAPNQSLIEYVTGDSNSYILLVNPDTILIHEISKDIPLDDWVEQFRNGLTKYHSTKGMPKSMLSRLTKDYAQKGQQLYQQLIAPIAPFLNQEVIIIPDGVLGYIPFEILLSQKPKDLSAFHNYPYFFKDHTISYCYSATLLQEMKNRKHRKTPIKQSLSIAPFFKGDIAATLARIDTLDLVVSRGDTLQALPFSGDEAAKIAKITSGDHWLGTEANLDNFIKKAPDYRILHLSTHGIADDKVGDYAYLAFGNSNSQNQYEKLFIRDIYNIPLNADMVVLSACKTAYGKLQRGEGIISMARAFAYAGSKSIITSHWSVDDQSTGVIMEDFYRELAKGFSKDKALQKAKLTYLENNKGLKAHPFYWAAFIGIGDMSKIDFRKN